MKKITSEETSYQGRFLKIKKYIIEDSRDQSTDDYECMDRGESACAVVYNKETSKYLFVKQFRVGAKKELIELVA